MDDSRPDPSEGSSAGRTADNQPAQRPSRSKKRSSRTNSENAARQSFLFVDSTSPREKRAHVMRHHIQTKRSQNAAAANPGQQTPPQTSRGSPSKGESDPSSASTQRQEQASAFSAAATDHSSGPPLSLHAAPSFSVLSAPIETVVKLLPMEIGPIEYELVDNWLHRLTYWSGQNSYVKERVFRRAMQHPVPFRSMVLSYSARWKAHRAGITNQHLIDHYATQTELAVNNPLDHGMDEDDLVMTLAGLHVQEERYGDQTKAVEYVEQALRIQRNRITLPDPVCQGILFFVYCMMMPRSYMISLEGMRSLVDFLRRGEVLVAEQNTQEYLVMVPQRASTFGYETELYQLLASGPRPSRVPMSDRSYVVNDVVPTTDWSRSAALIYIMTALWSLRHSPGRTSRFLNYLTAIVRQRGAYQDYSCESFVYMLMEEDCDYDLKDPHRLFLTAELLQIPKILPRDLLFRFNELVLGHLMMASRNDSVDNFERDLYAIR